MTDLTTSYLGLTLPTPVIVGSSGLTFSVKSIAEHEKNGAGAVVLKSLLEEQIQLDASSKVKESYFSEAKDHIFSSNLQFTVSEYQKLIEETKKKVLIPVIASVNCVSIENWSFVVKKFEEAGADAIELNAFILPSDFTRNSDENESFYFKLISEVTKQVSIPVSLKMSYYFTNLAQFIQKLSFTGLSGIVLFNRFYSPDIDLKEMKIVPANILSEPAELSNSLRWIAIMAGRVHCDLCASTGIHDGDGIVKQILAGANAVQVVSALYKNKNEYLKTMIVSLKKWMDENGYKKIDDFRGMLSQANVKDTAAFERVQFMRYFSGIE